jgi:tetratricopeptide (TPR) repeat protein
MMTLTGRLAVAAVICGSVWGQRYATTINAETPDGAQLQAIGQQTDPTKKLELMEKFVTEFPKSDGASWVYSQIIPAYIAANNLDKAGAAASSLLALHPDDLEGPLAVLKAYEKVPNSAEVIKWSKTTWDIAKKQEGAPKPNDAEEAKSWESNQTYVRQVQQYAEYSLMNQAGMAKSATESLDSANALERLNPKSQYLGQTANATFVALQRAGQTDKAVELAEKTLARDPSNEEMLLVAANHFMTKQNNEKALSYATKLVEVMGSKQKPAAVSDEDWTKRQTTITGVGNWISGMIYAQQNKLSPADKSLRAALPTLTDDGMKAGALYQLGFVNFKIGEAAKDNKRLQEALRFSQQSAAIKSPYQASAAKNVAAIRAKVGPSAAK